MKSSYSINVNDIEISWDTAKGICTFAGIPVAMMWVDSTLLGLMSGVQQMVGTERFLLTLQCEGRNSVEDDWKIISTHPEFENGFKAIANIAQVAGWGKWTLIEYDEDVKKCVFRVENSWEGHYQKVLGANWGCGIVAGKFAGYCSKLFNANCWPTQTSNVSNGDSYDEFVVTSSIKSIEDEIDKLLLTDQATHADMAVALEKLRLEVDEHKQVEKKLSEQKIYYESLFSHLNFPAFVINKKHEVVIWNKACELFTGLAASELIGTNEHWRGFYMEERPCLADLILDQNFDIVSESFETQATHPFMPYGKRVQDWCSLPTGKNVFLDIDAGPIFDSEGNIIAVIEVLRDITERIQSEKILSYQATHDALTGLINRNEFERRAERLISISTQDKEEHALFFMDLDQFKVVNDTCGHAAGDELLRQLTLELQKIVRHNDTLARLGGDEFGVLMEHCSLDAAHRVATTLLTAVQNHQFVWEEHSFKIGVSIGLVVINEDTLNLGELLKQADAACYMAKDLGRNRIHVYQSEDTTMAQRHGEMQWVSRIHRAIEEGRFCLYAQAIVPLNKSPGTHYELLIRMIDEEKNIIPPGAFLPAAERYNLISMLDRWVVKKAFILLAEHPDFINQINFVSINLSGKSLADDSFKNYVIKLLNDTGINGNKVCFEITETAAISNFTVADKFITELKQFGCSFALDDFGSGLSSFGYLKNLHVDYLKIDGMFVKDIADDLIDHAMVKSINEIGHVMGMKTIAEFVENDEVRGMLREIGVDYVQGYGIHKPQPFDELLGR